MRNNKIYLKTLLFVITILVITSIQLFLASTINYAVVTPETVKGLSAQVLDEKVKLSWDNVTNASGYEVHIDIPGKGYTYIGDVSSNSAWVKGFAKGVEYKAKIRAYIYDNNNKNYGDFSSEVSIELQGETLELIKNVEQVQGLTATVDGASVKLTWNKLSDVSGYEVYVALSGSSYQYIGDTTQNAVIVKGFKEGNTYNIKIRAFKTINGQKEYGDFSKEVSVTIANSVVITKVTGLTVNLNERKATVTWDKVADAEGYEIYYSNSGSNYRKLDANITTNAVNLIFTAEGKYYLKVRAYKTINGIVQYGDFSNEVSVSISNSSTNTNTNTNTTSLTKVTGLSAKVTGTKVYLDWNNVSGAEGYEILLTHPTSYGSPYNTITSTTSSRTISGITNTEYYYTAKVRAYKTVNGTRQYGEYSNEVKFKGEKTITLTKVTGVSVTSAGTGKAKLTWNKVNGADGYEVFACYKWGNWIYLGDSVSTQKTVSNLKSKYTYYFTVRAYYIDSNGNRVYGDYSSTPKMTIK